MADIETMEAGGFRFRDSGLQWFALLEGAHPAYNTLDLVYKNIATPEWVAIYQFAPYEALAKVSPVLIKLDHPHKWLQQWQQVFPGLAGSMLGSETSLETVADHLRTLVSVRVEGGVDSLFRFHDSWIASALYPTLEDTERAKFHGPICQWLWPRGGEVCRAERPGEMPTEDQALSEGWLQLSTESQLAVHQGLMSKRNWKEGQR
ncbi:MULTISPECIES: DUF4123 domain-containing protein [Marinobacter]|jgi:hypothetical protein|uniref:DUF4123 domain-containing protein n=1 Tax=Marinobacter TaxID=2742 RepID=UPI001927737A|nr:MULTISPECIES: DUF4123 domain-containing protein [Marinobacter]MBL3823363.1 DUF4123 domain-containing protein [Marinobacter sp. MC3]MBL3892306.1 DUF4123 domain-containing protein [Marinobacter sp. MW3]MCD1646138.1 DUF4123 domain-containing protein [Marinobacter adhaerens]